MRKTKFQIHDDKVFEGYSDNTSWNGFANPYFDEETYKQVVSYYIKKSKSDEENLEYWNEWKTDFKNAKGLLINTDSQSPLTVFGMGFGLCCHEVRKEIKVLIFIGAFLSITSINPLCFVGKYPLQSINFLMLFGFFDI